MNLIKKWLSSYDSCDICQKPIKGMVPWFVDGKTKMGPWGLLCPSCFIKHGVGIGYGIGQKYDGHTAELLEGGYEPTALEKELEGYEP